MPDAPASPPAVLATADELREAFERPSGCAVGVVEELMLLDRSSGELTPVADLALARATGDSRFAGGQHPSRIAVTPSVAGNAQAVGIGLAKARLDLDRHVGTSATVAAAGTHPWASGRVDLGPSHISGRSRPVARASHCAVTVPFGLRVRVAVTGAERALQVYNALRSHLPELAALSANSPFVAGLDSGCASVRSKLSEAHTPGTGVPPALHSWGAYADFVRWGQTGGVFQKPTQVPWGLRLQTRLGALELRVADTQTRIEDTIAIVALFQGLVASLADELDRTGRLPTHASARIAENARRAARDGVTGWLVDPSTGAAEPTRDRILRLVDRVEEHSSALGNESGLLHARALVLDNGAERQRYVAASATGRHGLRTLIRWLTAETRASAEIVLERRA